MNKKDLSFILNHLGEDRENYFNAVSPPIIQTSNFSFPDVATMRENIQYELHHPYYTRGANPTVNILRKKLAALEGTEDSLVFSSGVAAISAAVLSQLKSGDHVVCVHYPYSWTCKLFYEYLPRFGITTTMVNGKNPVNFENAITKQTRMIYLESPDSVTFEMQDLQAVSKIASKYGLVTVIDNSYASPLFQNPADYGIDIIVHSATKYLNGHSDVVAGVVCSSNEIISKMFYNEFMTLGGIIAPHEAWLLIRGLRTLQIRMQKISETTSVIVEFMEKHPMVEKVMYPGSATYEQKKEAAKYLKAGSGQFSVIIKAKEPLIIEKFCNSLKRFLLACSWGGHESLVYPLIVSNEVLTNNDPMRPWNLIRFYIGLEDSDVLIQDLTSAFAIISE